MNLKRAMFWKRPASRDAQQAAISETPTVAAGSVEFPALTADQRRASNANVFPLQVADTSSSVISSAVEEHLPRTSTPQARIQGLLNAPELEAFFKTNQCGFGRHHGTRYRSLEALDRGLDAVVAEFQHIVAGLAERRQAKVDRLQLVSQEVATLSDAMAGQVNLALEHTQRELAALREQAQLAEQRKGWVLDALNRYRLGFDRGVRDALDFELLGS